VQSFSARVPLLTATSAFGISDWGEDAGVLLNSVIYTVRVTGQLVILLPGCFLKTFTDIFDIMFLSLLSYVLTFLFNTYCFYHRYFITFNKL